MRHVSIPSNGARRLHQLAFGIECSFQFVQAPLAQLSIGLLDNYRGILKMAQSPPYTQPASFTLLLE